LLVDWAPFEVRIYSAFWRASRIPNQLSPRLPARKSALETNTFKQDIFLSESPGGCAGPLNPRLSEKAEDLGLVDSPYESRLDTTLGGIASFARLVKNASRGVVNASIPDTFVMA
jgi:hypothetical protein